MKRAVFIVLMLQCLFFVESAVAEESSHYVSLLKEMFRKVALEKNEKAIPEYYSKEFKLYSNGKEMNYSEFLEQHQKIYKTPIQYQFRYDEQTFLEQGNKVAGRVFITTKMPNEPEHEIEVILVATYKDDKLFRLWELTYPDWSKMKAFKSTVK